MQVRLKRVQKKKKGIMGSTEYIRSGVTKTLSDLVGLFYWDSFAPVLNLVS